METTEKTLGEEEKDVTFEGHHPCPSLIPTRQNARISAADGVLTRHRTPPGGAPGAARLAVQRDSSVGNLLRPMCNTSTARAITIIAPEITRMRKSGIALSSITSRRVSAVMAT